MQRSRSTSRIIARVVALAIFSIGGVTWGQELVSLQKLPLNTASAGFTRARDAVRYDVDPRVKDVRLPATPAVAAPAVARTSASIMPSLGGFNIVISPSPALAANVPALNAFTRAANQWAGFISDPITVTVSADLQPLGPGIIGSTSSVVLQDGYNTIRNQLVANADADDAILASTPTAAQFSAFLPVGFSLDGTLIGTKAQFKAQGFTGLDGIFGTSDGSITFSSAFSFDFDNSNGVAPGTMDFETVAAHEIGHLLGFISSVDDVDVGFNPVAPSVLDLMRFRNLVGQKPTNGSDFTTMARGLVPGDNEIFSDVAHEYRMATGVFNGDGDQASHWKADELTGTYIGIMDPTLAFGQVEAITNADRRAMDLIGYDVLIPEPASIGLILFAGLFVRIRSRRA
jgi:hypothetical protein